jgi:protein-S-isoprenylcysteine O-methyltransferase Ste14
MRRSMMPTRSFVRLQEVALAARKVAARKVLAEQAPIVLRLLGLKLASDRVSLGAAALQLTVLSLLGLYAPESNSSGAAIACFLAALALRFGFTFASFTPTGVAPRLVARLGVERGHAVYATVLDLLLFAQRASFIVLLGATARQPSGGVGEAVQILGALMVPVGAVATLWAVRVVGVDTYHYRDLFTNARQVNVDKRGPYALCENPMYALGPLAGYGLALLALSPIALLAAAANQALLYLFNELVEQPRLQRAHGIFIETQRRYELARSLLGFDPREELAQRRHWVASSEPAAADDASRLAT